MVSERGEEMAGGKAVVGKKKRSSARGEEEEAENEAADADGNFEYVSSSNRHMPPTRGMRL